MSIENPGKELKANMTANAEIVLEEHPDSLDRAGGGDFLRRPACTRSSTCCDDGAQGRVPRASAGQGAVSGKVEGRRCSGGVQAAGDRKWCWPGLEAPWSPAATYERSPRSGVRNLRANKLRSFLTMFGILWGVISVVILSATGEGFQHGNQHVLDELGKNIGIVWGGRTSQQAGGERAGRPSG